MPKHPTETASETPEDASQASTPLPAEEDPRRLLELLESTHRDGDPAALDDLVGLAQRGGAALVDLLIERVEALRPEEAERAKGLAKLGLRLAAKLPNTTFARVWDLWSTTCADVGLDDRAEAGRTIAAIFDESLRPSRPGQARGGRKRKGRRRKPGQG